MDDDQRLDPLALPPFAQHIGMRLVSASREEVVGELPVTGDLINRNGVLHGGALMSFADNMGGTLATAHLRPGQMTTTVESKTNFLRAVAAGDTARAVAVPLHAGRRTVVVETRIYSGDGRLAAVVTQTQMTIER